MRVSDRVNTLRASMVRVSAESELIQILKDGLEGLRRLYPRSKHEFCDEDVRFLKSLTPKICELEDFEQIREEVLYVDSVNEYESLESRLQRLKTSLELTAIGKSVAVVLRDLRERRQQVIEEAERRVDFRQQSKQLDLEQTARPCPKGHRMVIRHSPTGLFWGCSRFPDCQQTRALTREHRIYLNEE